tara:strand:+ start:42 stop:218 length:177 start_codon:yes stop_codon:yes gene_type:complete
MGARSMEDTMIEKRMIIWFNLFIGFYNIYLWSQGDWLFNLIIGSINIGVWVFFRNIGE